MLKKYRNLITILIFLFCFPSKAHVDHYKNLNLLEYNLYRNNKLIGEHVYSFSRLNDEMTVRSEISFKIKKLGVILYKYSATSDEFYKNDKLVKFNSKTNQNKKLKYVNLELKGDEFVIDGSSNKSNCPSSFIIGTWWNHSILKAEAQISAVSGRIIQQKVIFLGKEEILIGNKEYNSLHFNFMSTDPKLSKDKKLNIDIWYDENSLVWLKSSFNKKGRWEYRLKSIK